MTLEEKLTALLAAVREEAQRNPEFATRIERLFQEAHTKQTKRTGRRQPGPFDPFEVYREAPSQLRGRLNALEIDELRNIVAEHGMDPMRLAMKWKSKERIVDLIVDTVRKRSERGHAFREAGD